MPYIKQKQRMFLDEQIDSLVDAVVMESKDTMEAAGLTNYALTTTMVKIMNAVAPKIGQPNYATHALFAGVLAHMQQEIYRRLTAIYEDKKIQENTDVEVFK